VLDKAPSPGKRSFDAPRDPCLRERDTRPHTVARDKTCHQGPRPLDKRAPAAGTKTMEAAGGGQ